MGSGTPQKTTPSWFIAATTKGSNNAKKKKIHKQDPNMPPPSLDPS